MSPDTPNTAAGAPAPRAGKALLWFASWLVLLSLLTVFLFGRWHAGFAHSKRNPHLRRAWAEHVWGAEPKQPDEMLVLIISNSQGYGYEHPDADTYPCLLEARLRERLQRPVRVLNWSIAGGRAFEYAFLAAAAHRVEPGAVLLVAAPINFNAAQMVRNRKTTKFPSWSSDTHHLAGYGHVRAHLPAWFLRESFNAVEQLDIQLARWWPPWRYRDLPAAWLSRFATFRFFHRNQAPTWFLRRYSIQQEARQIERVGDLRDMPPDWRLADLYLGITDDLPARRVYVSMPLLSTAQRSDEFDAEMRRRFEAAGGEMWDLDSVLPDVMFLSHAHLTKEGHRAFAETLAERLAP